MNPNTGDYYPSVDDAIKSGEKEEDIVEVVGTEDQVKQISEAIKANNKAKEHRKRRNKLARRARKRSRG